MCLKYHDGIAGEELPPSVEELRSFAYAFLDALGNAHLPNILHMPVDYRCAMEVMDMSIKSRLNLLGNNLLGQKLVTMKHPESGALVHLAPKHVNTKSQKQEASDKNFSQDTIKRTFGKSSFDSIMGFDHDTMIHEWFHKYTTLMSVYLKRVIFVPMVEAGALSKTITHWQNVLGTPVTSYQKNNDEALALKAGLSFRLMENAWKDLETGGNGLLDPTSSTHPQWGITVRRTEWVTKFLCVSRLVWYATAEQTRVLSAAVQPLMMLVEESVDAVYFSEAGTCSTTNCLVSLNNEVRQAVNLGGTLWETMNGITMENIHPALGEQLLNQAFSGRVGAASALARQAAKFYAEFVVTEGLESMNCSKENERSKARRQKYLDGWFRASGQRVPVAGRIKSEPADRSTPPPGNFWHGTKACSEESRGNREPETDSPPLDTDTDDPFDLRSLGLHLEDPDDENSDGDLDGTASDSDGEGGVDDAQGGASDGEGGGNDGPNTEDSNDDDIRGDLYA